MTKENLRLCANQFSSIPTTTNNLDDHQRHHYSLSPFSTSHDLHHNQHLFSNPPPITHISLNPNYLNPSSNISQNSFHIKNDIITTQNNIKIPNLSSSSQTLVFSNDANTSQLHKGLLISPLQNLNVPMSSKSNPTNTSGHLSATALLQKATTIGTTTTTAQQTLSMSCMAGLAMGELGTVVSHSSIDSVMSDTSSVEFFNVSGLTSRDLSTWKKSDRFTRDFLGLTGDNDGPNGGGGGAMNVSVSAKDMLTYTRGVGFQQYECETCDHSLLKPQAFGFNETDASQAWDDC